MAQNTIDSQMTVTPCAKSGAKNIKGKWQIELSPLSWNMIRLR